MSVLGSEYEGLLDAARDPERFRAQIGFGTGNATVAEYLCRKSVFKLAEWVK